MNEEQKTQAWEEEFNKFVDKNYEEKFGLSSTYKLVWGCEECSGEDAESDIKKFIRTLRQKDKERLMEGVEKLWNKNTPLTKRTLPDGRIEYKQSGPFNVTESSLEDFKNLLNQIYE